MEYLRLYLPEIALRGDKGKHWTNLRDCAYIDKFFEEKISFIYTAKNHHFFYDKKGFIVNNSCFIISTKNKFIWAFLNSSLFKFYQTIKFVAYGDAETSGRVKLDRNKMLSVPILRIDDNVQKRFDILFKSLKRIPKHLIRIEIDALINKIYNLSQEEIDIIETSVIKDFVIP